MSFIDPDGRNPIKSLLKALLSKRTGLVSGQKSYIKLIKEHTTKLENFKKDPIGNSSKEWLEGATKDNPSHKVLLERAEGRIPALEKQLKKQEGELAKINNNLKELDDKVSDLKNIGKASVGIAATPNNDRMDEIGNKSISFGAIMTDLIENIGTKIFGKNEAGQIINDLNPLNLGLADLFKQVDTAIKQDKQKKQ